MILDPQTLDILQDLSQTPIIWKDTSLSPDDCKWSMTPNLETIEPRSQIDEVGMGHLHSAVMQIMDSRGEQLDTVRYNSLMASLSQVIYASSAGLDNIAYDATQELHDQFGDPVQALPCSGNHLPETQQTESFGVMMLDEAAKIRKPTDTSRCQVLENE